MLKRPPSHSSAVQQQAVVFASASKENKILVSRIRIICSTSWRHVIQVRSKLSSHTSCRFHKLEALKRCMFMSL